METDAQAVDRGISLLSAGEVAAALEAFGEAVERNEKNWPALANICVCNWMLGYPTRAVDAALAALEIEQNSSIIGNLANALMACGRIAPAISAFHNALLMDPSRNDVHSGMLISMLSSDQIRPDALSRAHAEYWPWHRGWLSKPVPKVIESRKNGRPRIGYMSPDLRRHSVAWFFRPVLESHDRDANDVVVFDFSATSDDLTRAMQGAASRWFSCAGISDGELAKLIKDQDLDLLIDLAGHTSGSRVHILANRLARAQGTYLGYPDTTGIPGVQFRVTDSELTPTGLRNRFSEIMIDVPGSAHVYSPPPECEELDEGEIPSSVVFGSTAKVAKYSGETIRSWAEVLSAVPRSVLRLKSHGLQDLELCRAIKSRFSALGVDPQRIELSPPTDAVADHFSYIRRCSVMLDTVPYTGTTSVCEAAWMGVPTLTRTWDTPSGHVAKAIMRHLGAPELVTHSRGAYVSSAVELARSGGRLATYRRELRARVRDRLGDGRPVASTLELYARDFARASRT